MRAKAIHKVLAQGRTVQNGWSNLPDPPGKSHPALMIGESLEY